MPEKLTPALRKCLEWFAARREPQSVFGQGDPTLPIVKRALAAGYLETTRGNVRATGNFMFTAYQLSPAGREALTKKSGK